ncbi:43kDa postsynaptic protein [Parasponia andersonii]|uniref:RING-type E3 ubiquitin transferase n=1 Tax=Parasponia andersonii TaxID=3476 RepID=A0A2P5CAF2_PARAD|nr:43kDa postsynaptic protein [Parasponia andersonii]
MAQDTIPDVRTLEEPDPNLQGRRTHVQNLDSISQWCTSITDVTDDHNCNPFASASTSFVPSPVTLVDAVGPGSSCASDWFSESGSESDRDISCFVTDLFDRRGSEQHDVAYGDWNSGLSLNDLVIGGSEVGDEFGSNFGGEIELGERSGSRGGDSGVDGLRVVGFDSESESEDGNFGVLGFNSLHDNDSGDRNSRVNDWDNHDNPCLEDERSFFEEFDWEEVEERANERENLSIVIDDYVEEVPAGEDEEAPEEGVRSLEWEILLAINNLAMNSSLERNVDSGTDSYLAVQDDYTYTVGVEYESLFEQFIETESALKGSPPAAKSVVENLPFVELTVEELMKDDVVCAVCKDQIVVKEKVKRLPCSHCYHGDCIVPWLGIRNTCPVCRYELPTDDLDYERRKSQRAHRGPSMDSQVIFNFELST